MQRLVKPSDYVLQDVLGQSMYQIPWEPRLCPGNPAEDPEVGALLYNAFVQDQANGVLPQTPAEQMSDILDWVFETAGEPARSLAADLAAAYLGKHAFLIDDGVWVAMEPKTNVSSESHRKGAFRSPAHPPGITL